MFWEDGYSEFSFSSTNQAGVQSQGAPVHEHKLRRGRICQSDSIDWLSHVDESRKMTIKKIISLPAFWLLFNKISHQFWGLLRELQHKHLGRCHRSQDRSCHSIAPTRACLSQHTVAYSRHTPSWRAPLPWTGCTPVPALLEDRSWIGESRAVAAQRWAQ